MNKRLVLSLTVSVLFFSAATVSAKHHSSGLTNSDDDGTAGCSQVQMNFDDRETVRSEQHLTIPSSAEQTLSIRAAENGGIRVIGGAGSEYDVTVCKAAAGDDRDSAQGRLAAISAAVRNNELSVSGPGGSDWNAYLIVRAPRNAAMDVAANNGPISLRNLGGAVKAHSVNGPISLKECSGDIQASTENGPISLSGSGGKLRLETQNGPISVDLSGSQWKEDGLEARTENGPLSLKVPAGYAPGVRVEASGHSPMRCSAAVCGQAQRTWDDEHRFIELGSPSPAVRMSTVNGPVSVESSGEDVD
ncbi:MAG: hypothetical protein ACLQOO_21715 [Terriglobia bacterium]